MLYNYQVQVFPQNPTKCPHRIVEFKWITDKLCYHYCLACGEKISDNFVDDLDKQITGQVRKLNNKERKLLR